MEFHFSCILCNELRDYVIPLLDAKKQSKTVQKIKLEQAYSEVLHVIIACIKLNAISQGPLRNENQARAITWLVGVTICWTIFK